MSVANRITYFPQDFILEGGKVGYGGAYLAGQRIVGCAVLVQIPGNFSGQLKKYKVTINDLLAENEKLEARAKASEKGKMKDTMERAKLKSELDDLQRLVDRIPPDILAKLKRQQRHTVAAHSKGKVIDISKNFRRPCAALYLDN